MQKAPLVILLVMALVLAALMYALMVKRSPAAAPDGTASGAKGKGSEFWSAAEASRLRAEVEALRKDAKAQRRRAEEAESKLAELKAEGSGTPAGAKKSGAKKGDWKKRRDAELEAKVKSMAWRKNFKGVYEYWKELEKSRAEGRAVQMTPELMTMLNGLTSDMNELSKFLGLEGGNSYEVFQNPVVGAAWEDAFLQEIGGGSITEEQLARLRATSLYEQDPDWDITGGNILERWKTLIERNLAYGTETAGILTPEQHALVTKAVTPTFMLSLYAAYGERTMSGAAAVTDYWVDSFKVPAEQRATVELVAGEFAKRLSELTQTYTAQYGASPPREAEFELRLKALDLQIAAEKKLAESLQLDPEQAKKFLKGSGAVIKMAN